ncbi:transcription initiation factor TFIID subunit 3 isoform X2 [Kryptolebias marmoratus]|uniref:transcription initiation factor TFIID subunit 3 isoform X2 n=1 Tax=Kryptolebias marmoratus TaxID=37003 RepID=UPI0007F93E82|nr:transcription initiation factor TFIID subunit 3 isoform X2 [Kryptolebias marmoratus]
MVNQIIRLGGGSRRQSEVSSLLPHCSSRLPLNSFIAAGRMEETSPPESKPEPKAPDKEEGGIRRRLRDRDLLRKRKAEAEEKETNQVESQRKRSRAENKSGAKKRGRPRKAEGPAVPEPAAVGETLEGPADPSAFISDQIFQSLASIQAVELQPAPPAPTLQSVFVKSAADPVPVPDPAPSQDPVPAVVLTPQVETLYTESQGGEVPDQVLIEDLGPDEEEEVSPTQDRGDNEGLNDTLLMDGPEPDRMYSVAAVTAPLLPHEFLPGSSL